MTAQRVEEVIARDNVATYIATTDGPRSLRIWDCIEKQWMERPVPDYLAHQVTLRQVVIKCSACDFTTTFEGGVKQHLERLLKAANEHQEAVITALPPQPGQGIGSTQCSGCGAVFAARKNQGQRHLETALALPSSHTRVEEVRIQRYSLGPVEPVVLKRTVILEAKAPKATVGPVASQVVRSEVAAKRKRRRSHNRRQKHGNSSG